LIMVLVFTQALIEINVSIYTRTKNLNIEKRTNNFCISD
jgi:hypothetical protein